MLIDLKELKWLGWTADIEDESGTMPPIGRKPKKKLTYNCLIDAFFEKQKKLPPELRSSSCMIACKCRKCSPYM